MRTRQTLALCSLLLCSCLTLHGHDFDLVAASQMQAGKTTRAEAEEKLGVPTHRRVAGDGALELGWTLVRADAAGKNGVKLVTLEFGQDGVLRKPPKVWADGIDAPLLKQVGATAVVERPSGREEFGRPAVFLLVPAAEAVAGCFDRAFQKPSSPLAWGAPRAQFRVGADGSPLDFTFVDVQPPPAIAAAIQSAVLACRWKPRPATDRNARDPVFLKVKFDDPRSADWVDIELALRPSEAVAGCMAHAFPTEHRPGHRVSGTILVRFLVNERGRPEQFEILPAEVSAAHRGAIVTALARCEFNPGRNSDGKPLPVWSYQAFDVTM